MNKTPEFRDYFAIPGLQVSDQGSVRRVYNNKSSYSWQKPDYHYLNIKHDEDGNRIVNTRDYGELRVDRLVAICFFGKPRNNKRFIIHRDLLKDSCWKNNLCWASAYEYGEHYKNDPQINTPDGFRFVGDDIFVNKQGEVKQGGLLLTKLDYIYDSDTDSHVAVDPFYKVTMINSYGTRKEERVSIDKLVADAYLPPHTGISLPCLLHRDLDYANSNYSNLKWVEADSQEYKDYMEQRKKDIAERNNVLAVEFNGH